MHAGTAPATEGEALVATPAPGATAAAIGVLRAGGNAVDAAVAAGWALAVCEPSGSGLGGQATMLVRTADGDVRVLDGHSRAPAGVSRRTVSPKQQRHGHRACTIPSMPAVLGGAQARWGRLPLAVTLTSAQAMAEEGIRMTPLLRRHIRLSRDLLAGGAAADALLPGGRVPRVGVRVGQPELARTLARMAIGGVDDFYRGEIAAAVDRDMSRCGGLLTKDDLAALPDPEVRRPLASTYRGHRLLTSPAPGGGPVLALALEILEHLGPRGGEEWYDDVAESTWHAFQARAAAEAAGVWATADEMVARIRDTRLATDRRGGVDPKLPSMTEGPGETAHLCVADADGMVVSLTQSVQSLFGGGAYNAELGFFYNNYLRTCSRRRGPHGLSPGCIPRSNVCPTLVLDGPHDDDAPRLVAGSAGSRRIVSSMVQTISGVLDHGRDAVQALSVPRVHPLPDRTVLVEAPAATAELTALLGRHFGRTEVRPELDWGMGAVQALSLTDVARVAAADPRRDGTSAHITLQPQRALLR